MRLWAGRWGGRWCVWVVVDGWAGCIRCTLEVLHQIPAPDRRKERLECTHEAGDGDLPARPAPGGSGTEAVQHPDVEMRNCQPETVASGHAKIRGPLSSTHAGELHEVMHLDDIRTASL